MPALQGKLEARGNGGSFRSLGFLVTVAFITQGAWSIPLLSPAPRQPGPCIIGVAQTPARPQGVIECTVESASHWFHVLLGS